MKKLAFLAVLLLAPLSARASQQNYSGTITTGGTFQLTAPAVGTRTFIDFINTSADTCYLFISTGTPTTGNSVPVSPGQEYFRSAGPIPNEAIYVTCTTTSDTFYLVVQ